MIEFKLLGPIQMLVRGKMVDLGPPRQCSLLAALLVEPGQPLTIDTLINRVWGDAPPVSARDAVYTYVTRLRNLLVNATAETDEPVHVNRGTGGYFIGIAPERVDVSNFLTLVDRARSGNLDDSSRADRLADGLRLWNGTAMTGLDSDWAKRFSDSLHRLKHEATAEWADAEMRRGNYRVAITTLRTALLEEPLVESLQERLVRAYYANGESAQALRQYELARRLIAEELGADPSPAMRDLHSMILRGDAPITPFVPRSAISVAPHADGAEPEDTGPKEIRPKPPVPDMVPREPFGFAGRDPESNRLVRMLTEDPNGPRPVLLTGGPGVGKSALAVRVAHAVREQFPDGLLYAELVDATGTAVPVAAILGRLLIALGMSAGELPSNLGDRVETYRTHLANRRILVVLDDAVAESQITPLVPLGGRSTALVTSRFAVGLTTMRMVALRELDSRQSLDMLVAAVGPRRVLDDYAAAQAVVAHSCGNPLALRAVACQLTARPHRTFGQILARTADEHRRLDQFRYDSLNLRASLDRSFARLDDTAARVFALTAAIIGPDQEFTAPDLPDLAAADTEEVLDQLVDAHLLTVSGRDDSDRTLYRMLEIHRIYAKTAGELLCRAN